MMEEINGQERMAIAYTDEAGRLTLDLPRLTDIFCRAGEEAFEQPELANVFNVSAQRLGDKVTEFERNGRDADIGRALTKIALLARDNGIKRVVLPIYEGSRAGEYVKKNVMFGDNFSRHYGVVMDFSMEL